MFKKAIKKKHGVYSKWKQDGKPDAGKAVLKTVNEKTDRKIFHLLNLFIISSSFYLFIIYIYSKFHSFNVYNTI